MFPLLLVFLFVSHAALLAGRASEAPPAVPSRPQSSNAEKEKIKEAICLSPFPRQHTTPHLQKVIFFFSRHCAVLSPQEYEVRLATLQAEYDAEQESRAKLQEDIAALRSSCDSTPCDLETARASRGRSTPRRAAPQEHSD